LGKEFGKHWLFLNVFVEKFLKARPVERDGTIGAGGIIIFIDFFFTEVTKKFFFF
jgi:hypothetical protein